MGGCRKLGVELSGTKVMSVVGVYCRAETRSCRLRDRTLFIYWWGSRGE
jgi:hypothetical protein